MVPDSDPVYSSFHSSAASVDEEAIGVEPSVEPSMLAKESPDEDGEMGVVVAVWACRMAGLSTGRKGDVTAKLRQQGNCRSDEGGCRVWA